MNLSYQLCSLSSNTYLAQKLALFLTTQAQRHGAVLGPLAHLSQMLFSQTDRLERIEDGCNGVVDLRRGVRIDRI